VPKSGGAACSGCSPQLSQIVGDDGVRLHTAGRPVGQVPDFPVPANVMEDVMPAEALTQPRELGFTRGGN